MARVALLANAAAVFAILIAWRLLDGTMFFLVQAWYELLLYATAAALAALACIAAWPAVRSKERARIQFDVRAAAGVLFVAVPLVLLLVMPVEPLGSQSIERVSGDQEFVANLGEASSDPLSRNVFEWAIAFRTEPPSELTGQPVDIVAFVYHPEGGVAGTFMAARFVVACCVADARGVTLPVEWPEAASIPTDAWVQVSGVVAISTSGAPFVRATAVTAIDAPANPYLYP